MGLLKKHEAKGIMAEYWAITDLHYKKTTDKTEVDLSLFYSQQVREQGLNNELAKKTFEFDGFTSLPEAYLKITESNKIMQEVIIVPPVVAEMDKAGDSTISAQIITPAVTETVEVETNEFAGLTEI